MNRTPPRHGNQRRRATAHARRDGHLARSRPAARPRTRLAGKRPTALLRSLGDPPLAGTTDISLHFAIVIERTAALAAALALSADLLAGEES